MQDMIASMQNNRAMEIATATSILQEVKEIVKHNFMS
jgi:type IV secretory pathway VirD2 relaxase